MVRTPSMDTSPAAIESPSTQTPDLATPTWPEGPHREPHRTQHGAQKSMRPPGLAPDLQTRHKGISPTSKNPLCDLAFAWHGHGCQCGKTHKEQNTSITAGNFFLEQILIMNDTQKLHNILLFQLLLSMTISVSSQQTVGIYKNRRRR
jgi:hypothetical protein